MTQSSYDGIAVFFRFAELDQMADALAAHEDELVVNQRVSAFAIEQGGGGVCQTARGIYDDALRVTRFLRRKVNFAKDGRLTDDLKD